MREKSDEFDFFDLTGADLAKEWSLQAARYHNAALDLADAKEKHDRSKAARDLEEAELDRDIRHNKEKYGIDKLTEPVIEKTIIRQVEFQRINNAVIEAKHQVDVIQAHVDALEHRKRALENRVQLMMHDLAGEPRQPKNPETRKRLGDEMAERAFGRHNR